MRQSCGHFLNSDLCDDLCKVQNLPPTPDHNYITLPDGERVCPTYTYGGSMGEVCPTCGFEPPSSMSPSELKDRSVTRERLAVEVFFNSNDDHSVVSEILDMVSIEIREHGFEKSNLRDVAGNTIASWEII